METEKSRESGSFLFLPRNICRVRQKKAPALLTSKLDALARRFPHSCVCYAHAVAILSLGSTNAKEPLSRLFCVGGSEENRTPVRKPIHRTFFVDSLWFKFPLGRRSQTIYARG